MFVRRIGYLLLLVPHVAFAQEVEKAFSGDEFVMHFEFDDYYASQDPRQVLHDLYAFGTLDKTFSLAPPVTLQTELRFNVVRDATADRYFGDEAVWLRQLLLNYQAPTATAYAGLHTLGFGTAYDLAPGIYGLDFAIDYEMTERLGFGGTLPLGNDGIGKHNLTAEIFTLDNTLLSEAAGEHASFESPETTRPGLFKLLQGGASNNRDFSSYLLALNGSDIPMLEGVSYHLSVMRETKGEGNVADEFAEAVGLARSAPLGRSLTLDLVGEYVHFDHFDAMTSRRDYLTFGAEVGYEKWVYSLALSRRQISDTVPGKSSIDSLATWTIGYKWTDEIETDIGWNTTEAAHVRTDTAGTMLTFDIKY